MDCEGKPSHADCVPRVPGCGDHGVRMGVRSVTALCIHYLQVHSSGMDLLSESLSQSLSFESLKESIVGVPVEESIVS